MTDSSRPSAPVVPPSREELETATDLTPLTGSSGETDEDTPRDADALYGAWVVIANARDWTADDDQGEQWRKAAVRWRDANGFGVSR